MIFSMNATPLEIAIRLAGGVPAVAKALDISQPAIHRWRARGKPPANRVIYLERATNGKVTRYDLRPDVFGPEPAASPRVHRAAAIPKDRAA